MKKLLAVGGVSILVAALVLGMDSSLTPAEVRQIIRDGAIDMGSAGFDRAYGYGRIDVLNSLESSQSIGVLLQLPSTQSSVVQGSLSSQSAGTEHPGPTSASVFSTSMRP